MSAPTVTRDGDLITVTMPTDSKRDAIAVARKAAGGMVANTGQPVTRKGRGYVFTYSAVTRKPADDVRITITRPAVERVTVDTPPVGATGKRKAAPVVTGEDDRLAFLERELARVTALLAATAGEPVSLTKAAKPAKARPAYVPTAEQARRAQGGHSCDTCQDLHVVRGSGPRAGQAYRTAAGAAAATAPVPCPACRGKRSKRSA